MYLVNVNPQSVIVNDPDVRFSFSVRPDSISQAVTLAGVSFPHGKAKDFYNPALGYPEDIDSPFGYSASLGSFNDFATEPSSPNEIVRVVSENSDDPSLVMYNGPNDTEDRNDTYYMFKDQENLNAGVYMAEFELEVTEYTSKASATYFPAGVPTGYTGVVFGVYCAPLLTSISLFLCDDVLGAGKYVAISGPPSDSGSREFYEEVAFDWNQNAKYIVLFNTIENKLAVIATNADQSVKMVGVALNLPLLRTAATPHDQTGFGLYFGIDNAEEGNSMTVRGAYLYEGGLAIRDGAIQGGYDFRYMMDHTCEYAYGESPEQAIQPWHLVNLNPIQIPGFLELEKGEEDGYMLREEPLLDLSEAGYPVLVETTFRASSSNWPTTKFTGVAIVVDDGTRCVYLGLLQSRGQRTMALTGNDLDLRDDDAWVEISGNGHSWMVPHKLRWLIDPTESKMTVFLGEDTEPLGEVDMDAVEFQQSYFGRAGVGLVLLGSDNEYDSEIKLHVDYIKYHKDPVFYDSRKDGLPPTQSEEDFGGTWTYDGWQDGGVGFDDDEDLLLQTTSESTLPLSLASTVPSTAADGGVVFESRLRVSAWKDLDTNTSDPANSIVPFFIDSPVSSGFRLGFVDLGSRGKYIALMDRVVTSIYDLNWDYLYKVNWTEYHTYKVIQDRYNGLKLYQDGTLLVTLKESEYSGPNLIEDDELALHFPDLTASCSVLISRIWYACSTGQDVWVKQKSPYGEVEGHRIAGILLAED